jgi:hypothetical protein
MSSGQFWLLVVLAVLAWFGGKVGWQVFLLSRVRKAAARTTPVIEELERVVVSFYERFPRPEGGRLPLEASEYPEERPRKPSPPRTYQGRARAYRRRYR